MPLMPRDGYGDSLVTLTDRRATRVALSSSGVSSSQTCQAIGVGEDISNDDDLDFAQHFGFISRPPADSELIKEPGNPVDVSVAELCDVPSGDLANIATGQTSIYDSSGNFVYLRGSNGVWIKTLAGPISIEVVNGQTIKLHKGGTTRGVAYSSGSQATSSTVRVGTTPVTGMQIWINAVTAFLNGLGAALPPGSPSDFGWVATRSAVVEVEP